MSKVVRNKAENILTIDTSLINKEEVFKMISLAYTTGMPLLLIGDPGTAKTKTVIDYAKSWLLDKVNIKDAEELRLAKQKFIDKVFILETDEGTKQSEVKGLPSFSKLFGPSPVYELDSPITEAEVIVINEVDKASSAIRNSLLGIMNEKFLFNGKHKIPCKWKLFIATCNEIPREELKSPFWDRFILKMTVNRISPGDMVKYYDKGGREYKETIEIGIPNKEELNSISIPTSKLEKYIDVAYTRSSDRTLTFVPTLAKAVSFIWDLNLDKSLVKVADIMIDTKAASELQGKLMSTEVRTIMSKVEMLYSINDVPNLELAMVEIETLLTGYAAKGSIDRTQVEEIEKSIQYVLQDHPVKQKEREIEEVLEEVLTMDESIINSTI